MKVVVATATAVILTAILLVGTGKAFAWGGGEWYNGYHNHHHGYWEPDYCDNYHYWVCDDDYSDHYYYHPHPQHHYYQDDNLVTVSHHHYPPPPQQPTTTTDDETDTATTQGQSAPQKVICIGICDGGSKATSNQAQETTTTDEGN